MMQQLTNLYKVVFTTLGGWVGFLVGILRPTFPLCFTAIVFIVYDALTAFWLDKRAHQMHPQRMERARAKFNTFAFRKVVERTIPKRLAVICLAFLAEKFVFIHVGLPLSYIVTGVIIFEQAWSILENESSCRSDKDSRFWKMLQRIMVDKTERHFDISLDELKEEDNNDKDKK